MKRIIWLCLVVLFIAPSFTQAGVIGPAHIKHVEGDVMFRTPDDDEWLPASINTPLDEGDAVWCPEGGRMEIQLADGSMIRLDGDSQLDLFANEDGFTHLHLASGRLYLRTSQTSGDNALQIDADDTTVLPAARTWLRIDMLPNNQEDVAIFKGTAYVEGNGNRTKVRAGEHIALEEGHNELLPLNPADSWERWNMERDRSQSRSAKLESNLPDELRSHSAELDSNGTWVRTPEYGMVWRPTVILTDDWAPYRSGRWIWKGDDYVWVSYERWGWVPYHYGRWAVVSGFGWCWVPPVRGDVYWGPGFVGWYSTGSHVGWTPLAPGELFYGRRYYGRHSAVITSVNINPTTVVYRNRSIPGGLTVIQHSDFLRGRSGTQQPARNESISVSVSIGSPRIRPLRETRMPVIKQTPPRVAAPRIEHRDSRELRARHPRIAPESVAERRRQQSAPAITAPAAPQNQPVPVREKRTVYPAGVQGENRSNPGSRPQEVPPKRDEYRPRAPGQQTLPQPGAQTVPALPGSAPQRTEQPKPKDSIVTVPVARPQPEPGKRDENRQRSQTQQTSTQPVSGTENQQAEQPKKGAAPREMAPQRPERSPGESRQKKVWRVTTPENTADRSDREKGHKDKERR